MEAGFFVAKGAAPDLFAMLESDEHREMYATAMLTAKHLHSEMLAVGEGIEQQLAVFGKALAATHL